MKATEAAKLADVMQRGGNIELLYKVNGHWFDKNGDLVDVNKLCADDYVPLVPMKTYKVGDVVTFAEALQSGMCFQGNKNGMHDVHKLKESLLCWWNTYNKIWEKSSLRVNNYFETEYTIVPDPSATPKPTIADLEFGTMFKAKNYAGRTLEFIKGNNRFISDNDVVYKMNEVGEFKLTHIKRDGEWEEV